MPAKSPTSHTCAHESSDQTHTVILFDWDDTLLPSSWLDKRRKGLGDGLKNTFRKSSTEPTTRSSQKSDPLSLDLKKPLSALEVYVETLLKTAMNLGKVIIVTNAMEPWVHMSCKNYLPNLFPLIEELPVIYARSVLEGSISENGSKKGRHSGYPWSGSHNEVVSSSLPQRWKETAFDQILESINFFSTGSQRGCKSVISIGDSSFERNALRHVVKSRLKSKAKCHMKTAKLLDEPSVEELTAEVRGLQETLKVMVRYEGNLDVEIQEKDLHLDLSCPDSIANEEETFSGP